MWVDYRGPLSTVYNDGEISTCGWIMEVHSVQSTMMGGVNTSVRTNLLVPHSLAGDMMIPLSSLTGVKTTHGQERTDRFLILKGDIYISYTKVWKEIHQQ